MKYSVAFGNKASLVLIEDRFTNIFSLVDMH